MATVVVSSLPRSTNQTANTPLRARALLGQYGLVVLAILTWALLIAAATLDHLFDISPTLPIALYIAAYLSGGTLALKKALTDLFEGSVNVDLLMVTAAIGAAVINAWGEGAVLLALFASSNALEHFALDRTRNAVRALMALTPEVALVLRDGQELLVRVEDIAVGERVLIKPGERVPVDGQVVRGRSDVDQATITGESVPVSKSTDDSVFAGTMNGSGALEVKVIRHATDSTLARIVRVVSNAREQQGRTQRFAEAFEGKYAIGVIAFSTMIFLVPWIGFDQGLRASFYRAMIILVVMSPCALVISTPASTLSALANAARNGVLFKGGAYLEAAGTIPVVAFDKTGTLTTGHQAVTDVISLRDAWSETELLRLAASIERFSEHHISQAVVREAGERSLELMPATDFSALPGRGVSATIDGQRFSIGNRALLQSLGMDASAEVAGVAELLGAGKTVVYVTDGTTILGVLATTDSVRPDAKAMIARLRQVGVKRIVMITGDNAYVAQSVADELGIDDVRSEVLPDEKLTVIEDLKQYGAVAMVGDGVNDAPAMAVADLGVAMGGSGTDVALETADVVLITDDLNGLAYAMELSRRTHRTIIQNLAFSLGVIAILTICALTIGIPLPLGVVGHEGSTVIVVLNGLRLLGWGRS